MNLSSHVAGMARALTIAGSDPSGGAGIQADLKTFHRFGAYGMSALTLVTVQNTVSVAQVELLAPALVAAQIDACVDDIGVDAVKTGALGSAAIMEVIASKRLPKLVVDPVMVSKHGSALLPHHAIAAFTRLILPRAFLLTPNVPEAQALLGAQLSSVSDLASAARALCARGAAAVLLKGGHLEGQDAVDCLVVGAEEPVWFVAPRIATVHTHGTGCTFSAAITALLARGMDLKAACREAKAFISAAIAEAPELGRGNGPVNHWAEILTL